LIALLSLALAGPPAGDAARGEVLAGLGGCASCHTADDGPAYAGGHAIVTEFGTFYGTNLTPHDEHGLGRWSFDDFVVAMTKGRSPEGRPYWPAFPYPSFTGMTDADLADLWAFLQTLEPVDLADVPHDASGRWRLPLWRMVAFRPGPRPVPDDPVLARGAYLVQHVGHCGECHTPRSGIGRVRWRHHDLQGTDEGPKPGPSLVELGWTDSELDTFLVMGMEPDGDFAGNGMGAVVAEGTSRLSADDRAAMIAWLQHLQEGDDSTDD
jgi:mono/diheme cytochrome c family protein